jgi:hypothetical protein
MKKKATLQFGKHNIGRFHFLLLTLVLIIFFRPFLDVLILTDIWVNLCTDIFLYLALMSGLYAMSDQTVQLRVSWVLIGIVMILGLLQHFLHSPGVEKIRLALTVVYLIKIMVMIWTYIEKEKKNQVKIDLIMAAACTYILIGMIWAYAYFFVESYHPGSFKMPEHLGNELSSFNYYSFVTLTTVGYGDIQALTRPARTLSILEAILGQLYLVIMISRLVGLHASQIVSETKNTN